MHAPKGSLMILNLVGGPALIAAGFAFLPTPGPSYIIVIGLWMLAGELLIRNSCQ